MKKLFILLAALVCMQVAVADEAAKIKIHMSGAGNANRYFLCLPDVGCLSILAAEKGKTYPIFRPIEMSSIYITDVSHSLRVSNQGLPRSCQVTVQPNQTLTISGNIVAGQNGVRVNQLHCTLGG